jgi:hypothetical protein
MRPPYRHRRELTCGAPFLVPFFGAQRQLYRYERVV